jgi:hypothetical protein
MADDKQFSNVPQNLQSKMERCVQRVKADGKSKSQAIAICFESVVRGKDLMSTKQKAKRRKRRRAARALNRAKEKQAAGEPLSHEEQTAIAKASFKEDQQISPEKAAAEVVEAIAGETEKIEVGEIGDVLEFEREEPEAEKHMGAHLVSDTPQPTSFADLDKVREVTDEVNKVQDVLYDAQLLVDNVLHESAPKDVSGKLATIADELDGRIENPPDRKEQGFLANFKEKILGGLEKAKLARAKKLGIGELKDASGIQVFKSKDGFRWFGWVSNKWRDRDWPAEPELGGQIITEAAHKEFVLWVDESPKERMPQYWHWHTPESAHKERADWIDYSDGFLMMSGPLTEKEAELLTALNAKYDLAMSHGLVRSDLHYDKERGLIQKYRTFEASDLPRKFAANEWTDIVAIAKEVATMGLTPEKREFLVDAMGEELVMGIEEDTEGRAKALEGLGVEFKGMEEALSAIAEPEEAEEMEEAPETEAVPAKEFEGLSKYLEKQAEATEANSKAIVAIGGALVELSKSDDAKVAAAIRPKISMKDTVPVWQRSASESKENIIEVSDDGEPEDEEDKDLLESKPGTESHWMEEVLGAGAVEVAPVPK